MRIGFIIAIALWLAAPALAQSEATTPWVADFETGDFQDEGWLEGWFNGYVTSDQSASTPSGWTVICGENVAPSGNCAYKGWINDTGEQRAYPVLHADFDMPLVNTFWLKVEPGLRFVTEGFGGWFSVATWANTSWSTNTLSLVGSGSNWRWDMAHFDNQRVGDPGVQLGEWMKVTAYLDWSPAGNGDVAVWIDDTLTFQGTSNLSGNMRRSHYGAYGTGVVRAVAWNDEIRYCTLDRPLTSFDQPPSCPGDSGSPPAEPPPLPPPPVAPTLLD